MISVIIIIIIIIIIIYLHNAAEALQSAVGHHHVNSELTVG